MHQQACLRLVCKGEIFESLARGFAGRHSGSRKCRPGVAQSVKYASDLRYAMDARRCAGAWGPINATAVIAGHQGKTKVMTATQPGPRTRDASLSKALRILYTVLSNVFFHILSRNVVYCAICRAPSRLSIIWHPINPPARIQAHANVYVSAHSQASVCVCYQKCVCVSVRV